MTLSTSQLRQEWAPPCTGPFARVHLHGAGVVSVRPSIVDAVLALNAVLVRYDYRTRAVDTGAYNCRRITGGTGYSLHAYGIALDINWQSNPYGRTLVTDMPRAMVADIKAIRTKSGHQVWRWGGDYATNKDAMHFEIVCTQAQLATGIAGSTPTPTPNPPTEDDMTPEQDARLKAVEKQLATVSANLEALAVKGGWGHPEGSLPLLARIAKKLGA